MSKVLDLGFMDDAKSYDTALTPAEEAAFAAWKARYAPRDSGADYDLRGAFKAGLRPDAKTGHWPDTFKKPNHPTFSDQSQYAVGDDAGKAGSWDGDTFVPPGAPDVTVNLDFLDGEGAKPADPKDAWRQLQAARFPASAEERAAHPENVAPEVQPIGDALRAFLPLANPALLWNDKVRGAFGRAVSTGARDLWGMATTPLGLLHPKDMAEGLGQQRERSETSVGKAWQRGDYPYAITRGLLNMVPFGPGMGEMLDESGVDPAAGAGHAAALVAAPKVLGPVMEGVKAAPGAIMDAARTVGRSGVKAAAIDLMNRNLTPVQQYTKAMRPLNSKLGWEKDAPVAMQELKAAADRAGLKVEDVKSLDEAHELAMDDLMAKQKQLMGDRPVTLSGKPVAEAIKKSVPKMFRAENPEAAASIDEWADRTYDRDFTHEELNEFRKDANASNAGYYGKLPQGQAAMDRKVDSAIKVAKGNAIRNTLYDGLEADSGTGEGLRDVNRRIKALMTSQDVLDRRYNVEQRQALQNLPQQVGKLAALGKFGAAAKELIKMNPGGALMDTLTGIGEVALTNLLKEANSTGGQIASAFRRLPAERPPVAVNPVRRAFQDRALPAAGAGDVLPSTETGAANAGSTSAQSQWQRPEAVALPQGLREDPEVFQQTGTGSITDRMRAWLAGPKMSNSTDMAHVPGRGTSVGQPRAEEPAIDVPFRPIPRAAVAAPGGRLALPESTAGREVAPNPLAAEKTGVQTTAGPTGNKRGAPIRLKATAASKAADKAINKNIDVGKAGYYIDRDPKTGWFRKVYTSMKEANAKKGQKGAVPIDDNEFHWDDLKSSSSNKTLRDLLNLSGVQSSEEGTQMKWNESHITDDVRELASKLMQEVHVGPDDAMEEDAAYIANDATKEEVANFLNEWSNAPSDDDPMAQKFKKAADALGIEPGELDNIRKQLKTAHDKLIKKKKK